MRRAKGGEMPQPKNRVTKQTKSSVTFEPAAKSQSTSKQVTRIRDDGRTYTYNPKYPPFTVLSEDHLYFAKRYALNENAAKASRESGFSEWYGSVILAKDPLVIAEVARIREVRRHKFDVSAERIIEELTKVAFGTLGDFITLQKDGTPVIECDDVGAPEMAALAEITQDTYDERVGDDEFARVKKTKIKMHNKVAALDKLASIFKLIDFTGMDKDTPDQKAAKIRAALKAMAEVDGG